MKNLIKTLAFAAVALTFTLQPAAYAQAQTAASGTQTTQGSDDQAKRDLYTKFYNAVTANKQAEAYESAQEYVRKYPNDTDDIAKYVRTFITTYEKSQRAARFTPFYEAINKKDYNTAFAQGKQLLATEPNNMSVMMNLVYTGYLAVTSGNSSFNAEASNYAKQVIQLIESGKTPEGEKPWYPFNTRDEALTYLNYYYGVMNLKSAPADASVYIVKAIGYESPLKRDPAIYHQLAYAYQEGEFKPLNANVQRFVGKEESPESKAALANLYQSADRIIDALARAIAYTDADPKNKQKYATQRAGWMEDLTRMYKFRNKDSDAGLTQFIAGVTSKPLPKFTPITPESMATTPATTATPAATPTATPTTTGTTPPATTTRPATTTTPSATTPARPATGTTTTTPPATNNTRPRPAATTPPTRRP
ncbi:MAG: hypothetical protein H0V88_14620 [Pyrinomonadaceae bacterium]|nr:hypothetical protein [Pyrinomonadaceae bacterium]